MTVSVRTRLEIASGDRNDHEFAEFLTQLIKSGRLEGAGLGVFKFVLAQGDQSLTEPQKAIFYGLMNNFVHDKCDLCSQEIPWSEMYSAIDTGTCAACANL